MSKTEHPDVDELHRHYRATGDPIAQRTLVERYAGLARSLALRAARRRGDADDLVQVAMYGLLRALERFDPSRGVQFSTFAHATIDGELKRYRRNTAWSVHVPRRLQELYLSVGAAIEELTQELGRGPSVDEVGARVGCDPADVIEVLEFGDLQHPRSLDQPSTPDERTLDVPDVDSGFEAVDRRALVAHLLTKLNAREREIVELRFVDNLKQGEIATKLGISQMHVSRLLRTTIDRLRVLAAER